MKRQKRASRFFKHQLKSSLSALLISVLTISVVIYHFSERALLDTVKQSLQYHANFRIDRIYALLDRQKEWMIKSAEDQYLLQRIQWLKMSYGRGVDTPGYRRDRERFIKEFALLLKQQGVEDLLLITADGELFFSLQPMEEELGVDLTSYGFYGETILSDLIRQVSQTRQLALSRYGYIEQISGSSVLMGVPLHSNFPGTEGELQAIMVKPLALEQMRELFASYSGLGESGEVMIAQMRGEVLGEGINYINRLRNAEQRQPDERCQELRSNHPERFAMTYALARQSGAGWKLDYSCREVYTVWSWLPALQWGMVIKQDREEIMAPVAILQRNVLTATFLVLLFLFWVVRRQARAIVHPIEQLTRATEQGTIAHHPLGRVVEVNRLTEALQKRTSQLLHAKRETELILESMSDALLVVDQQGVVIRANPTFDQLTGAESGQLVGCALEAVLDREQKSLCTLNGEQIPVSISQSEIEGEDHSLQQVLVLHDLRDRRNAEQQAQYAAFQAGISEMSTMILHNVGNSLTAMGGALLKLEKQLALLKQLPAVLRQAVEQLDHHLSQLGKEELSKQESVVVARSLVSETADNALTLLLKALEEESLARLNSNLHHVSEIVRLQQSSAKVEEHAVEFELSSLIRDVLTMQQDDLDRMEVAVSTQFDVEHLRLFLPRNQLLQALNNLIKNGHEAITQLKKNRPQHRGEIHIHIREQEREVAIMVQDNGIGIAADDLAQVSRYGFSSKADGSGFGLHATHLFMRSLKGILQVESPGLEQGATVSLIFPQQMMQQESLNGVDR